MCFYPETMLCFLYIKALLMVILVIKRYDDCWGWPQWRALNSYQSSPPQTFVPKLLQVSLPRSLFISQHGEENHCGVSFLVCVCKTSSPLCLSTIRVETVASPRWTWTPLLRVAQKIHPSTSLHFFCSHSEPPWPASITSTLAPVQCFNAELNIGLALCCCA